MSYLYLLKQQWNYAKTGKDRFMVILSILLHSLSNGGAILFPLLFKILMDQIAQPSSLSRIWEILALMLATVFFFDLFHRAARFLEYSSGCRIRENAVDRFYRQVYNLPMKWHQDHHSGDSLNRIRLASESLFTFIESQFQFIGTVILAIGPFISLLIVAWDVALLMLGLVGITLIITRYFDRILVPIIAKKNERIHRFTATLFDFISNMETLITLGIGKKTEGVLAKRSHGVSESYIQENNWTQLKCQLLTILGFFLEMGITGYFIITRFPDSPLFTAGTVIMIHQYCTLLKNNTITLASHYYDFIRLAENFRAVEPILESKTQEDAFKWGINENWNTMEIDQLAYRYNKAGGHGTLDDLPVFSDLDLTLQRGRTYSLTGPSGAGKSTLLKLLRGLYNPTNGSLKIDGQVQGDFSYLHRQVTLIPQTPEIFENTLRYNICLGMDISKEQLDPIIKVARLEEVIDRLPKGLDSDIREGGVNLSGGQRQRIALARGLLAARDSSILLLDEVTSSVDMVIEQQIYRGIMELFPHLCIVASIHRLHLKELFDEAIEL